MSGGSYNYLYCHVNGLENQRDDIQRMRDRLLELGYGTEAGDTQRVLNLLDEAERQAGQLEKVWLAVEWYDSGDSGRDRVDDAVLEYGRRRQVPPPEPLSVPMPPPALLGWRWVSPAGQVYVLTSEGGSN